MNDIAKNSTKERLERAIEKENLLAQDVAAIFGMAPSYISWIKNPKYWDKVGDHFWDKALAWVNSGQSLKEYSQKHGKALPPEKKKTLPPVLIVEKEFTDPVAEALWQQSVDNVAKEKSKNPEFKPVDFTPEMKDKIENAERLAKHPYFSGKKEEHRRLSAGEMVDLLLEEKKFLQCKIDAIDVLLKHYIS